MTTYNHEQTLNAALMALQNGDLGAAERFSRLAVENKPDDAEGWSVLGLALGDDEGIAALQKAVDMEPSEPRWLLHLGAGLMARSDFASAEAAYAKAAQATRGHPESMTAWGNSLMALSRPGDAAQVYSQALKARPTSELWIKFGDALTGANDTIGAAEAYEKAHTDDSRPPAMSAKLADIHIMLNQYNHAERFNDAVLKGLPNDADAGLRAANLKRWAGDHEAAKAIQRQFLETNPADSGLLAAMLDDREADCVDAAKAIAADESHSITGRRRVCFALARHFDREKNEAKAWDYAVQANNLYDDGLIYDGGSAYRTQLSQAIADYSAMPDPQALPQKMIYVMGPPRCGGSLLQTILAQTSGAVSVGERGALLSWLIPALGKTETLTAQAHQLAQADIAGMKRAAGDGDMYIDKTSPHILIAGLLAKIHSGAQFVVPRRDAGDMAVSMFFHDFPGNFLYTRSIAGIADYLALQDKAAQAWRDAGLTIIDHDHDSFVQDPGVHGESLFKALGLPWVPEVLETGGSNSVVRTFSSRQVRDGVSKAYQGRGERYADYLAKAGFNRE